MTFSLFNLWHFLTTPYDKLHDSPEPNAPVTRPPLGYRQKKQLEKRFINENQELFGEMGRKKRQGESGALGLGAIAGGIAGYYAFRRSYQALSGVVFGTLTFIVARHAIAQSYPWLAGYAPQMREYDRAFSLWVMYTQNRKQPFELPVYQAKDKLNEDIKQYKKWKLAGLTPYELEQSKKGEWIA